MLHCTVDLCAMQQYIHLHEADTPPPSRLWDRRHSSSQPSVIIENPAHLLPRRVLFLSVFAATGKAELPWQMPGGEGAEANSSPSIQRRYRPPYDFPSVHAANIAGFSLAIYICYR
jgi:hypothetical protein